MSGSGGIAPSGADRTIQEQLVIRKTMLSALGAGTLLLSALAAGLPAAARRARHGGRLGTARQARVRGII